jgi:hypothetical protein
MMKPPSMKCGCKHWIREDLTPLPKTLVGGDDHGLATVIAFVDHLEEKGSILSGERQKPWFIQHAQKGVIILKEKHLMLYNNIEYL